jgi:hypothetical protein
MTEVKLLHTFRAPRTTQKINTAMSGSEYKFPAFDDLPKIEGMPQGSIWGFYDKDGKKDEVGGLSTSNHSILT